jgi:hypothetical protein
MMKMRIVCLATVCALALSGVVPAGATSDTIPGSVVRTTVADAERDYELRGAALSADGATTELMIAARPSVRPADPQSLVWASVDASGRVLSQQNTLEKLSLADAASVNQLTPGAGSGFTFIGGRGLLVLPAAERGIHILRLSRQNESVAVRPVDFGDGSLVLRRTLATSDDRLILVGSLGDKSLLAEISADGRTINAYPPREPGMTAVGAVLEADGNIVVVCEQGGSGASQTWVGRVSPRGEVLAKKSFPGRPTDIARGADGTLVALVEVAGPDGSVVVLKAMAPDFSDRWTRSLISRQRLVTTFRIAPVASGGYIVAGTKDRGLWLSRVRSDGAEVWTEWHEPEKSSDLEMTSNVELVSTQDIFVAAYTAFVVAGRRQRQVVRTIRFRQG